MQRQQRSEIKYTPELFYPLYSPTTRNRKRIDPKVKGFWPPPERAKVRACKVCHLLTAPIRSINSIKGINMSSIFIGKNTDRLWLKRACMFLMAFAFLNINVNIAAQTPPPIEWLTLEEEQKLDQSRPEIWKTNIREVFIRDFAILPNGGILGVGEELGEQKQKSVYLRLNKSGNLMWQKTTPRKWDSFIFSVASSEEGSAYLLNKEHKKGQKEKTHIVRINEQGDVEWEMDLLPNHKLYAKQIRSTPDGGAIAFGFVLNEFDKAKHFDASKHRNLRAAKAKFRSTSHYFIKIDKAKNIQWEKNFASERSQSDLLGDSFIITPDGGFVVLASGYADGQHKKVTLIKYDSQGKQLWQQKMPQFIRVDAQSLALMNNGNIAVLGEVYKKVGQATNVYEKIMGSLFGGIGSGAIKRSRIVMIDKDGQKIAELDFGGKSVLLESITASLDGGIFAAGAIDYEGKNERRVYLIKLNSSGDFMWDKHYQENDFSFVARTVRSTKDGNIVTSGYSHDLSDENYFQAYFQNISQESPLTEAEYAGLQSKRKLNSPYKLIKAAAPDIITNHAVDEQCSVLVDIDATGKPFNARKPECKLSMPNVEKVLAAALQHQYEPEYMNGKPIVSKDVKISFRIIVK